MATLFAFSGIVTQFISGGLLYKMKQISISGQYNNFYLINSKLCMYILYIHICMYVIPLIHTYIDIPMVTLFILSQIFGGCGSLISMFLHSFHSSVSIESLFLYFG